MDNSLDKKIKELQRQESLKLIYAALKFNDAAYGWLQYEYGLEWIKLNMSLKDMDIVHVIAECRLFWSWWRNQWAIRDEQFIYEASLKRQTLPLDAKSLEVALEVYYAAHKPLALRLHMNKFVYGEINTAVKRYTAFEIAKLQKLMVESKMKREVHNGKA